MTGCTISKLNSHGVDHPLLSLCIERAPVVRKFQIVVLAATDGISVKTTLVSGLEAVDIESTLVESVTFSFYGNGRS